MSTHLKFTVHTLAGFELVSKDKHSLCSVVSHIVEIVPFDDNYSVESHWSKIASRGDLVLDNLTFCLSEDQPTAPGLCPGVRRAFKPPLS